MTPDEVVSYADGFLFSIKLRDLANGVCAQARFDTEAYTPTLYDTFEVEFPPHLSSAVRKRQAEFLAGRLIATVAMGQRHPLPIGADRGPVWPTGMSGSITHSHGLCAAIAADDSLLCGIDIEKIAGGSALIAILQRCMSDQERAWMDGQESIAPDALATLVFSAKECIFKALSPIVGRFFGFECAEIVEMARDGIVTMRLTENLHASLPKGCEIPVAYEITDGFVQTCIQLQRRDLKHWSGQ